jgi:GntR family transcriptional regulator
MYAGPRLSRCLEVSPGDHILRIVRLRLADEAPMAIETLHSPVGVVDGLSADDLTGGSFYELLHARFGVVLERGVQTVEPTVTDETESELLQVPLHSPAFLFERTTWARDGRCVEFVRSVYRGDRYRLTAELRPTAIDSAPVPPS